MNSGSMSSYRAAGAFGDDGPDEDDRGETGDPNSPSVGCYDIWRRNDEPNPEDIGVWISAVFDSLDDAIAFAAKNGPGIYDVVGRNDGQLIRVEQGGSVVNLPYEEE